jgi:hypothetical protein
MTWIIFAAPIAILWSLWHGYQLGLRHGSEVRRVLRQRLLRAHQRYAQDRFAPYFPSERLCRFVFRRNIQRVAESVDGVVVDTETFNRINSHGGQA